MYCRYIFHNARPAFLVMDVIYIYTVTGWQSLDWDVFSKG
jgi:hypothetical protein